VNNHEALEQKALEEAQRREQKKRKRMPVSGKSVFLLKETLYKSAVKRKKK